VIIDNERVETLFESHLLKNLIVRKWTSFAKGIFYRRFVVVGVAVALFHVSLRLHPRFVAFGGIRHCGPCAPGAAAHHEHGHEPFGYGDGGSGGGGGALGRNAGLDPACWVLDGLVLASGLASGFSSGLLVPDLSGVDAASLAFPLASPSLFWPWGWPSAPPPPSPSSPSSFLSPLPSAASGACPEDVEGLLLLPWLACQAVLVAGALYKLSVEISEVRVAGLKIV